MSYTSLHFALSEELDMLRDSVRHFAEQEIAPYAAEIDQSTSFRRRCGANWRDGPAGHHRGRRIRRRPYGLHLAHMIAMEEISRASASVALSRRTQSVRQPDSPQRHDAAQKQKYLPKLISGEHVGALAMSRTQRRLRMW